MEERIDWSDLEQVKRLAKALPSAGRLAIIDRNHDVTGKRCLVIHEVFPRLPDMLRQYGGSVIWQRGDPD